MALNRVAAEDVRHFSTLLTHNLTMAQNRRSRQTPVGGRKCSFCKKNLYPEDDAATLSNGNRAHRECKAHYAARRSGGRSAQSWASQEKSAQREAAVNRARVLSGETYRAGKQSSWKLGGSPSTTPETR